MPSPHSPNDISWHLRPLLFFFFFFLVDSILTDHNIIKFFALCNLSSTHLAGFFLASFWSSNACGLLERLLTFNTKVPHQISCPLPSPLWAQVVLSMSEPSLLLLPLVTLSHQQ